MAYGHMDERLIGPAHWISFQFWADTDEWVVSGFQSGVTLGVRKKIEHDFEYALGCQRRWRLGRRPQPPPALFARLLRRTVSRATKRIWRSLVARASNFSDFVKKQLEPAIEIGFFKRLDQLIA